MSGKKRYAYLWYHLGETNESQPENVVGELIDLPANDDRLHQGGHSHEIPVEKIKPEVPIVYYRKCVA
jgi:hypothetical protein